MINPTPKKNGLAKQIAKYSIAIAVAAVATYSALKPEEVARQAISQVQVSHKSLSDEVKKLQKWVQWNRIQTGKAADRSLHAEEACKAEVKTLTKFVTGYLMGLQNRQGRGAVRGGGSVEVKALVKALGRNGPMQTAQKASKPAGLPKLRPPAPLKKR